MTTAIYRIFKVEECADFQGGREQQHIAGCALKATLATLP